MNCPECAGPDFIRLGYLGPNLWIRCRHCGADRIADGFQKEISAARQNPFTKEQTISARRERGE